LISLANQLLEAKGNQRDMSSDRKGLPIVNKLWIPMNSGSIKINVDGAFRARTGEAAEGLIARDSVGQPHVMHGDCFFIVWMWRMRRL
jgi:hypothetical protein